jgi:hypothetical protein
MALLTQSRYPATNREPPMKHLMLAVAAALIAATPAFADPTSDDVHCFILAIRMAGSDNGNVKLSGTMGSFYWLGKLNARSPGLNLEQNVMAEFPKMTGDFLKAEASRCGAELLAEGEAEANMGQNLQKQLAPGASAPPGAAAPPAPAPDPN